MRNKRTVRLVRFVDVVSERVSIVEFLAADPAGGVVERKVLGKSCCRLELRVAV